MNKKAKPFLAWAVIVNGVMFDVFLSRRPAREYALTVRKNHGSARVARVRCSEMT